MGNPPIPEKLRFWLGNTTALITPEKVATELGCSLVSASNYLSRLENEGVLKRIARGEYVTRQEPPIRPELSEEIIDIHRCIAQTLPHLKFIIWSPSSFKQLFHDIPVKNYIFIEAKEREELMAIKEQLHECDKEVILEPKSKDFANLSYNKKFPIILLRRKSTYGNTTINGIETTILERCIIDIYHSMTREESLFAVEEFRQILENAIKAGNFNFSFANRYARMRNLDFEFDLIFSAFSHEYPNLVSIRPTTRIKKLNQVLTALFGERWLNYVYS